MIQYAVLMGVSYYPKIQFLQTVTIHTYIHAYIHTYVRTYVHPINSPVIDNVRTYVYSKKPLRHQFGNWLLSPSVVSGVHNYRRQQLATEAFGELKVLPSAFREIHQWSNTSLFRETNALITLHYIGPQYTQWQSMYTMDGCTVCKMRSSRTSVQCVIPAMELLY